MNEQTDQELLRNYIERKSDSAFAALVERYIDLVHSAALRMSGDPHSAKDITQCVFVALFQSARQLTDRSTLAGWLHNTARNLAAKEIRSQIRRRTREQEVAAMKELLTTDTAANWEEIAPHLDAAVGEVNEPERDAVLLRYFKNYDLRTVGTALGISDDAAQKRVSRAVDRLREFLTKRGVTAGTGGLIAAISANAVQAAPTGLAVSMSAAAVASTSLFTTSTVTTTKIIAMTTLQKSVVAVTIATLAGLGIYENRTAARWRQQAETLQQEQAALTKKIQHLESAQAEQTVQLSSLNQNQIKPAANSNELLRLRGEVGRLRRENEESKSPITHAAVTARYKNAQELARNGDAAGALREYLWCFDIGMRQVAGYAGVRGSYLLSSIVELGKDHPEALAALRERRDQAFQRILESGNDPGAALDYSSLNRALKEDPNLLAFYDQLPPDDQRRKAVAELAYDQLLTAQRYADALLGRSYDKIQMHFETGKMDLPLPESIPNREILLQQRRNSLIKTTVKDVEVLAGAGDLTQARTLAQRLLAYDNSTETSALLSQHLARAGQAGLLGSTTN
ncbi:MAG TPA: sigma-70 family RNA polymerase sigma factor [Verrucomicrobiae bacterium]|nr:sigma-70 family RNA polymerase sigma factor [Verrucomicrobiae bacterium]